MRSNLRLAWILAVLLGTAPVAVADYQASYGKGLEALGSKQWSEAAEWFRKAIEEQPEAGGKIAFAGQRHVYIPYHQLGLALYHGGALREASEAWRKSAIQGVVSRKLQETVDQYLFDLEERLAQQSALDSTPPPVEEATVMLSGAELESRRRAAQRQLDRADRQIVALEAADLQAVLEVESALRARRDQGIGSLRQAREIFESAGIRGNPIALREVHARAVAAAGVLESVVFSATRLALESERQVGDTKEIGGLGPEAGSDSSTGPKTEPDLETNGGSLVRSGLEIGAEVASPGDLGNISGSETTQNLQNPLAKQDVVAVADTPLPEPMSSASTTAISPGEPGEAENTGLPITGRGPPDFLRRAATAFFSARYTEALLMLDSTDLQDNRVRKHVHLFRAASLYALYLLGHRQEEARLEAAREAVKACRAIDPELHPTPRGFSPSFIRFFESGA